MVNYLILTSNGPIIVSARCYKQAVRLAAKKS